MKIIGIDEQEEVVKKINKKKVVMTTVISIIAIIIITIICLYMGNRDIRDFMDKYILMKNVNENKVNAIILDNTQTYDIYAYDKYISTFNKNTLIGYSSTGNKEYELTVELNNPIIVDTNNRFLVMAEQNRQKIYLISGNNIVWNKELDGNISRISVNKNGYVSVVLTGTSYKSIIEVFDSTGKEMFKTYLSSSIVMDTTISNDNKYLGFIEISANGTTAQSRIKTISIQKAQENPSESVISTITAPADSIALNLKYQDGNKLICMYDNAIYCIQDEKQEELINLNQEGQKNTFADIQLENYILRVNEKRALLSTESEVEITNVGSKNVGVYTIDGSVKEIYTYGNNIALNLGSEVHFIGTNAWLNKKYNSTQEVRKIVINNNFAGIVYRDKIELIQL